MKRQPNDTARRKPSGMPFHASSPQDYYEPICNGRYQAFTHFDRWSLSAIAIFKT